MILHFLTDSSDSLSENGLWRSYCLFHNIAQVNQVFRICGKIILCHNLDERLLSTSLQRIITSTSLLLENMFVVSNNSHAIQFGSIRSTSFVWTPHFHFSLHSLFEEYQTESSNVFYLCFYSVLWYKLAANWHKCSTIFIITE
jgi:hypothetical protein